MTILIRPIRPLRIYAPMVGATPAMVAAALREAANDVASRVVYQYDLSPEDRALQDATMKAMADNGCRIVVAVEVNQ